MVDGASFDNNIICICEKEVIAVASIADRLKQEMVKRRIRVLEADLDLIDVNVDPQGYSDRFEQLKELQNERRELQTRE